MLVSIFTRTVVPGFVAGLYAAASVTGRDVWLSNVSSNSVARGIRAIAPRHSTVTDFAKFRGWSTSHPRLTAM
jgi:hypothetical protein